MGFLDEVGKRITNTGQGMAQKTKNMTETIRINGMITDEGQKTKITSSAYVRSQKERQECLDFYKSHKYQTCDYDFENEYGEIRKGFIEVYHIKGLADKALKNGLYINSCRILPLCLIVCLLFSIVACSKAQPDAPEGITMFFADDIKIADVYDGTINSDSAYMNFSMLVFDSATEILSKIYLISTDEAESLLLEREYMIYTTMDTTLQSKLNGEIKGSVSTKDDMQTEAAILDNSGKILSIASSQNETELGKHQVGSTMKPIGVYAPALEKKVITYSTVFEDLPITQIKDETGRLRDWPVNANGTYSGDGICVEEALTRSLNTVAVRVLDDLGIDNSMDFLSNKLGFHFEDDQTEQSNRASALALGYINPGLTTVDMAGFYAIFENGGLYQKPYCITAIVSADKTIYLHEDKQKEAISSTTSSIMKRLLKNVVDNSNGTGHKAKMDIDIACKTGTTTNNMDNWCVGFSCYYVCGVWSGYSHNIERSLSGNPSVDFFKNIMTSIHDGKPSKAFVYDDRVVEKEYDIYTGELAGPNCKMTKVGYYSNDNLPKSCSRH